MCALRVDERSPNRAQALERDVVRQKPTASPPAAPRPSSDYTEAGFVRALEVLIAGTSFCVAVEDIDQMDRLEVGPPVPMAVSSMTGLGWRQGRPLAVVCPIEREGTNVERREASVVVFGGAAFARSTCGWAIEIDAPGAMLDVALGSDVEATASSFISGASSSHVSRLSAKLPPWVRRAKTRDKEVLWIDGRALLRSFME